MSEPGNRICPYCAERINFAAKVCPRCRQWLSIYSLRNPVVLMLIHGLVILVFMGMILMMFHRMFWNGQNFSQYRDGLSIVESRMNLRAGPGDPGIYVVGLLTNRTDVGWKDIQLDVRFFDKSGQMIDAMSGMILATALAHSEVAFRKAVTPGRPLSDYDSYRVYIRFARDSQTPF